MRRLGEIGEGGFEGERVLGVHEEEGHRWTEEDNLGFGVVGELLALEVLLPEGDGVVGEPVVLDAGDVFAGEADIVVGEVGVVGGELGVHCVNEAWGGGSHGRKGVHCVNEVLSGECCGREELGVMKSSAVFDTLVYSAAV